MKTLRDSGDQRIDASVLTIGAFDGVHLGHQAVIRAVCDRASELGVPSAVVTFDVHPALVVRPESAPKLLTTLEGKLELLDDLGVDVVYIIEFDSDRASTTAEEFMRDVFVDRLGVVEVIVGSDFHFGKGREGTVEFLTEHGSALGFTVEGLELVHVEPDRGHISSTAIRQALVDGDVTAAATMLGRSYAISGPVVAGDKRGRQIGFPTANVVLDDARARPANGVYAAWYVDPDGVRRAAAVNVGIRPTFYADTAAVVLEAHVLDFDADLYGNEVTIEFVDFLRPERRFDGIDQLRSQLDVDIERTRTVLADRRA